MSENIPFSERISCSVDEAVAVTGIGRTKLYEYIADGSVKAHKFGSRTVISIKSLIRMVETAPQQLDISNRALSFDLPSDPDTLLGRGEVAMALSRNGYKIKAKTLAMMASREEGPPYAIFRGRSMYRWGDALDWARSQVSQVRTLASPDTSS